MLEGRFKTLLIKMLEKYEIDRQYIDEHLSYWENKVNIEKQFNIKLYLSEENKYPDYRKYDYSEPKIEKIKIEKPIIQKPKRKSNGLPAWLPLDQAEFFASQKAMRRLPISKGRIIT